MVGVPTIMEKVCTWSNGQQVLDNQRVYVEVRLDDANEEVLVFRDLYRWFTFHQFR